MKIGIYDPYLDDAGGGEKYMMTIAEFLSKGHQVDVFWDNNKDIKRITQRFNLDLSKIRITQNIFSKSYSKLKRLLDTKKYDILILLSDGSIPLSLSGKTFISLQQPLPNVSPNLRTALKLKRIRAVFCNSQFTKNFVDKELGIVSEIIYPPVDMKAKKREKENFILHVGRFRDSRVENEDYKRQGMMVESFKSMIDKGLKGWKFVLCVGLDSSDEATFGEIRKSASGYPIEFLINKTNDELWDVYSKSKIYWHATGFGEDLEKHPELAEHFGISTVEAMGAGVVPIVINAGGQKEIVTEGQNGYLWNSLEELKDKTLNLINNKETLDNLSKNAKESATRFSKEKFYQNINNLITK